MIVTEYYSTRSDGVRLERTYSDAGMKIRNVATGAEYDEVINPENCGRQYEETNTRTEPSDPPDDLDGSIEYLVSNRLIELPTAESEPDYLHEREPEPDYFDTKGWQE